eukprot:3898093-Lingulodinium_polyedra.AAC.1
MNAFAGRRGEALVHGFEPGYVDWRPARCTGTRACAQGRNLIASVATKKPTLWPLSKAIG